MDTSHRQGTIRFRLDTGGLRKMYTMKTCSKCGVNKPLTEFHTDRRKTSGKMSWCKPCHNHLVKAGRYGLTETELDDLFELWDHKCAVCGSTESLSIDHDHNLPQGHPQYVRSILCKPCNTSLGALEEDPERIRRLADYAEKIGFKPNLGDINTVLIQTY